MIVVWHEIQHSQIQFPITNEACEKMLIKEAERNLSSRLADFNGGS